MHKGRHLGFEEEDLAEEKNPFRSPGIAVDRPAIGLNLGILEALRQTRPWVMAIAIVCFIIAGFAIFVGVGAAIFMLLFAGERMGRSEVLGTVFYALLGVVNSVFGLFLLRYAGRIKSLLATPTTVGLEEALMAQKSFWKFAGIVVAIFVAIFGIMMLLAFVVFFAL